MVGLNRIVFKGNYCHFNTFGDYCSYNTFGNNCSYNTFGNWCSSNTFGDYCSSNTFGNDCSDNTFGDYCSNNTFGISCYDNSIGNDSYNLNRAASYPMLYAVYGEITGAVPKSAFPIEFDHDGSTITYTWDDYRNDRIVLVWNSEVGEYYMICP